ncbi:hypothetical protein G6L37_07550 [Agrobacterium rubi]|nr:hypothetical protein [Agrobacterium rubi]NTF25223.1 hypothetical protein [Agrobacterium rubi]
MVETRYQIEFSNASPDAVEIRRTGSLDVTGIEVPADAMQFAFYDETRRCQAPVYFVTNDVEIGPAEDMKTKHGILDFAFVSSTSAVSHAEELALFTWDHPAGPEWSGRFLVPLVEGQIALFDRKQRKVVWPPSASE